MTDQEIVDKVRIIKQLKEEILSLRQERIAKEIEIVTEYKVNECNDKRRTSSVIYQDQIQALEMQIQSAQFDVDSSI